MGTPASSGAHAGAAVRGGHDAAALGVGAPGGLTSGHSLGLSLGQPPPKLVAWWIIKDHQAKHNHNNDNDNNDNDNDNNDDNNNVHIAYIVVIVTTITLMIIIIHNDNTHTINNKYQ